ncbi:MAG: virulence RhuM family protein [Paludibacteraceae bacterium]|nr:virulence RhuM family protein [Paludibacteraceae bacterium]
MNDKNEIILYQPDETVKLEVRMEDETVWLTQHQMADLFETSPQNITIHIRNLYNEGELDTNPTCKESLQVRMEGNRKIKRVQKYYNLDVIISVGYRVKSLRGTQFRQWANRVLKEYLLKGYSANQRIERLEHRMTEAEDKIDFFVRTSLPPVEGIFYDGNMLEPFAFVNKLIRSAREHIVLIDNYVDETVLLRLAEREENVQAKIYTQRTSPSFNVALARHNDQYAPIDLSIFTQSHDRFLLIDQDVYHIGASIKDLGKKWFAFCKMELQADEIMERLSQI